MILCALLDYHIICGFSSPGIRKLSKPEEKADLMTVCF